jgi:putative salt-induced outer membrane protein YdiY
MRCLLAVLLALPGLALAQATDSTRTQVAADTAAAPVVAPSSSGASGLPSSEFETYNVSGAGVRYTAALTGIYSTGTVERIYLTTSHTANLALGKHWLLPAAVNFSYGKQDRVLRERELLGLFTPAYQVGRLKYYALGEAGQSNLRAIARRFVMGGGVGYQFYLDTLRNEVTVSQFFLYEHTQYLEGLLRQVPRASTRIKLRLSKGPLVFTTLAFYQPSLQDFGGDYRVNSTSSLNFTVSRHLALTAAYTYSYESVAVEDRSPLNTNLTVGFTYSTGK